MLVADPEKWIIDPDENGCRLREGQGWKQIDGASNLKCAEYVRLFKLLKLPSNSNDSDPLCLRVSTEGLFSRGTEKGYIFAGESPILPDVLVDDTDTSKVPAPRYRHIEGNWYIYFDSA